MTAPLVLLLSAAHPPDDMRVVRKEGAALAAAGFRVLHLCRGADAPAREVAGVTVQTLPAASRAGALRALLRAAMALRPAVLHASEPDSWAVALLAARRLGAAAVLDVHEHYPSRLDGRLPAPLRPAARRLLRGVLGGMGRMADAVVLAKDGLAGDFRGARCVAVRNHALVPPGLVPRAHRPGPLTLLHLGAIGRSRGWPQLLAALALLGEEVRLLVIGRFTDGSEGAFRAEAVRLGLEHAAFASLTHASSTPWGSTPWAPASWAPAPSAPASSAPAPSAPASSLVAGCSVPGDSAPTHPAPGARIEVAGWMPAEAALARAAAEADVNLVLFQPGDENHRLALPHKLFDGMAAGLPTIAPAFAEGVARVVEAAGCGVLCDPSDPHSIAAAVRALADHGERARLGAAGRVAAEGEWGWPAEAARLVALYRDLAPAAATPPAAHAPTPGPAPPPASGPAAGPASPPAPPPASGPAPGPTPLAEAGDAVARAL